LPPKLPTSLKKFSGKNNNSENKNSAFVENSKSNLVKLNDYRPKRKIHSIKAFQCIPNEEKSVSLCGRRNEAIQKFTPLQKN